MFQYIETPQYISSQHAYLQCVTFLLWHQEVESFPPLSDPVTCFD